MSLYRLYNSYLKRNTRKRKSKDIVQISLSTSTSYEGEQNALVEELGTSLTVNFELDEPSPEGGLKVFVDSDVEQIVNRLDLPGFAFNPTAENIDPATFGTSFDNSGFFLTIDEGATTASFTIDVFDNPEPDTTLPETFDGLVEASFFLVAPDEVLEEDAADVGTLGDYTISAEGASTTVIFADEESQLTDTGESPSEPTVPDPNSGTDALQVSLFTGPDYLIEDERTVSAHAFNVTNGVIPEGGLVVSVDAPNLSEFDLDGISVEGGEIEAVRDGGFDLRMTEYTTLVNLPIAEDGETESGETASFSLAAGEGYEVVTDYSSGTFNLVDTEADIPFGVVAEPNDIVSTLVTDTQITPEAPSFSAAGSIYFDIGNRYLNDDGTYTYIDYNEDVDLYQIELSAGDTIAIETFEDEGNLDFTLGFITGVAVRDTEGTRLSSAVNVTPAAPDKLFGSGNAFNEDGTINENKTDTYQEFTASEDGIYYIGVASYVSAWPTIFGQEDEDSAFSIETPGLGNSNEIAFGNYEIEIDLLTEDNPRKVGTPTPPVSNPNITNPPTLSLNATPTTVDSKGNFTNAVVEFVEDDGVSGVNFTIQAEGEIPEEGIEFVLNSDANLFDYVSFFAQTSLPSTIGGQSLGAFYNEDGIPTGIRLIIEEPTMTVNLERTAPDARLRDVFAFGPIYEEYEGLETDGAENVSFFLQPGEGYEVASNAGITEVTYYDSLDDVPASTGGGDTVPEVGVTISESILIEAEGTETTITFTLSEPPPAEGVSVLLDSDEDQIVGSVLGQFDVLEAEFVGGDFPIANADASGFLFNITEQTATITLSVFDELTVSNEPNAFQEGILELNFALQPQAGYTIDSDASEITLSILDNPSSQNLVTPTAATADDGESTTLTESEGTVGILNLSLGAPPPTEGLTGSLSTDFLSDFDIEAIEVEGGTIAAVRDDGFDVILTEREVTVSLPVLEDDVDEGSETAIFTIEPGDGYETNPEASEVSFTIGDTLGQASAP
ncbi:MAG: D-alanyl-D-alanine carboxypeptidase, partial [Pleurocapsa sp.]